MIERSGRVVNAAVVGGGLAGLAAACTLAARGHKVTLFEKNEWVGGKAAVLHQDGFRFDMGPTILTLPSVLKRIFAEAGKRVEDYMDLVLLDPQWRCFFQDGGVLDLVADTEAMKQNLDRFSPVPGVGAGYDRFMQISKRLHEVSDRFFFWRSVGGIGDTMEVGGAFSASVLKDVLSLRMGRSVAGLVRSCQGRASRSDDRPLHSIRRILSRSIASRSLRDRSYANPRGGLVPDGRNTRRARGP